MPASKNGEGRLSAALFSQKALLWWLPILYFFISDSFYLRTYDSAQVKITLVQMGGVCLFALWLCCLIEQGRNIFHKTDLVCLAPFLAYFGYGIFSYLHAPYKFSSLDFFLRRIFYMTVPLIVIREFHEAALSRLTRILIWTTWLTVGYGFLQWFDITFFPPGIGKGPDPFIWRGAFGERIFSTFGNPNFFADFLVLIFPVLVCQYLKTRELKLVPLMGMTLFDLYATGTKGAWIGFSISLTLLTATYFWFFDREVLRRYWRRFVAAAALLALLLGGAVFFKLKNSNFASVNFRLFTWESTWEMVMTQPLIGTGIGSFWTIYPAFRRSGIFHIEGKHNTETDHSENEHLEVLFDEGILGFGIFIWLILSACFVAYRALGQLTGPLKKGQAAPPRAYDILGYLIAFQGMLAHNFFDVSMRFVSSGVYLGLLSGAVVNLSRGVSLQELHHLRGEDVEPATAGFWDSVSAFLIWPMRLAGWGAVAYAAYMLVGEFHVLQGTLDRMAVGGEILQWWIAWICFLFCVAVQAGVFGRVCYLAKNALTPLVVVLMVFPLRLTWGFFKADVHHNIAIFFSKRQDWDNALKNYLTVGKLNPAFVMSFYFKGNVFNDRFNMSKLYNEAWGDVKAYNPQTKSWEERPRDDFERALEAYAQVRSKAPNYVQMHHQMGVLHLKMSDWLRQQGRAAEAEAALDKALGYFELYRKIDPVFAPNHHRIAQIYMSRKQYGKAIETYNDHISAKECAPRESWLQKDWIRRSLFAYQRYAQQDGTWRHTHENSEAYTQLGNAYFLAGDLIGSERAYKNALRLEPGNKFAAQNLQVVYQRAHNEGRLRVVAPEGHRGPPTFELIRSK